ncbi:MAG: transketolase [Rickettsiales bacterium]|nr:transketolase [Rickettsiales bacterium]
MKKEEPEMTAQPIVCEFPDVVTPKKMADAIRVLAMDAVQAANSGHPGMPMGMADVATVLFRQFLKFDPKQPYWPDRDRFVLSAGHGSMLQYALMYLTGYEDITLEQIKNFRQWGAKTAGHPEFGEAAGIETTTGPLGQGVGNAVGMALAERMLNAEFGGDLVEHFTYAIAGDGCLMEGISQEAISLAGHLGLSKFILLWDDNNISIDGEISLSDSTNQLMRFEASGWDTQEIDGHDAAAIAQAIAKAQKTGKPSLIACKTTIGYGSPNKEGTSATHGAPLGEDEIAATREKLGWLVPEAFEIPDEILHEWRIAGTRGQTESHAWGKRLEESGKEAEFTNRISVELTDGWQQAADAYKRALAQEQPKEATRKSSARALEALVPALPELVGGSADLTGSNLTKTTAMQPVTKDDYSGRYLYWGIREHGMAATMNGLALHGGFVPYGGTFMVFTDYCRPSIRLAGLMKQRVIYVMTHDSIGLGEDGPTHQPVEHLPSLRAMPNVNVFRPADATETLECWALSLASAETPSIHSLSRQGLPSVRTEYTQENLCAKGGYVLKGDDDAQVTLISSGSEIEIALNAQTQLADKGITAKVVSLPCWELFEQQPESYRQQVLGKGLRVGIEAALGFGWDKWLGEDGIFVGMKGFGASAPAPELYKQFGITAENVVEQVSKKL